MLRLKISFNSQFRVINCNVKLALFKNQCNQFTLGTVLTFNNVLYETIHVIIIVLSQKYGNTV